jgi:Zn-dependent protease with chaperone function
MNFFEQQAHARRQTGRLLVYFLAAVALTVTAVDAAFYVPVRWFNLDPAASLLWHSWSPQAIIGALMVIGGGSLGQYLQLRGGGRALAEMVGARRIDFATTDARERQFLNVVAEMSIASGVPTPVPYVMDREAGINAFVAGLAVNQTVMVVTAGALETFDRDELQAVVGHEFSHILNGDMRLNVRLIALLAGILALGQVGSFLMRMVGNSNSGPFRRNDRQGGLVYVFLLGLVLWLIGSIGLFFGRLIKAAIARQRELLADASSVQFTRNPAALAEALLKIKHRGEQSWLSSLHAESMSHMCFGETMHFSALFATHPPLDERIAAIGKEYLVRDRVRQRELRRQEETAGEVASATGLSPVLEVAVPAPAAELPPIAFTAAAAAGADPAAPLAAGAALMGSVGTVDPQRLTSAQELYRRLPAGVSTALTSTTGAQALLYALVARQNGAQVADKTTFLRSQEPDLASQVLELQHLLEGLDVAFALPLTELALPRLDLLEAVRQREFVARLQAFARLDQRLSVFEFALLMMVRKHLGIAPKPRSVKLAACLPTVAVVIACLLRAGSMEGEALERTFRRLMRTVDAAAIALPTAESTRLPHLAMGMQVLAGLALAEKRQLLELAATAVLADAQVRLEEYELLRVVAALLDCPMPLLRV